MKKEDVVKKMVMPIHNPLYDLNPTVFKAREFFSITYESDKDSIQALLPEPLEIDEPIVSFTFVKQDTWGLGIYTACGQHVHCRLKDLPGRFMVAMYMNASAPVIAGREIWGFPKEEGEPSLVVEKNTLLGEFHMGRVLVARGTMDYKHNVGSLSDTKEQLSFPCFTVKTFPHVDGKSARICELVKFHYGKINVTDAWKGNSTFEIFKQVKAQLLPVKKVLSAHHYIADHTIEFGEVVYDYLSKK